MVKSQKILITGGLGFIGSHLCEKLLQDNNEIIVVTKSKNKIQNIHSFMDKITIEYVDMTDFQSLEKFIEKIRPNVILHVGGVTSHKESFENPMYNVDANAKSTLCILQKIKELNLQCRFILGSTFIVIGKPASLPINEETPCNPTTLYGANRLLGEHYCKIYHNVYNLDTLVFRITNTFGPREQYLTPKNAINYLIYQAFCGKDVTIYQDGKFFRDIIYISDVISAINTIIKSGKSGNLYWISSGKKTWFYEIGEWLEELAGTSPKYVEQPTYTKKVDVGNFLVDNSKLKSLGWEPKVTIKDGIKKTLEYFKTLPIEESQTNVL